MQTIAPADTCPMSQCRRWWLAEIEHDKGDKRDMGRSDRMRPGR